MSQFFDFATYLLICFGTLSMSFRMCRLALIWCINYYALNVGSCILKHMYSCTAAHVYDVYTIILVTRLSRLQRSPDAGLAVASVGRSMHSRRTNVNHVASSFTCGRMTSRCPAPRLAIASLASTAMRIIYIPYIIHTAPCMLLATLHPSVLPPFIYASKTRARP
jgi:hypothetical protein